MKEKKKVILAFSGGLDTSFCVPYLMEQGYKVVTVTVDTGGFSESELTQIAQKSKELGAVKHYQMDGKESMYQEIITYLIKSNGLYQGSYPNMCADRYVIAQEVLKVAKSEHCQNVAHGSTAMGNDQVRFDLALLTLSPGIHIISPIKEMGGNRATEQEFLIQHGFDTPAIHKKYSVNQNVLGVTYSGSEIDQLQEPDQAMFQWTKSAHKLTTHPKYVTIGFEHGLPVSLDGEAQNGVSILQKLNQLAGLSGFGKGYYTGDCIIGIKGHIVFEAPGILTILKAHQALEQVVLTKWQQTLGTQVSQSLTDLVYTGKIYDPAVTDLQAFFDSQQQLVTGTVKLKFENNQVLPVAMTSPYSLIQPSIAAYAQTCSWSVADANGFIKLFGLQEQIAAVVKKKKVGGQDDAN